MKYIISSHHKFFLLTKQDGCLNDSSEFEFERAIGNAAHKYLLHRYMEAVNTPEKGGRKKFAYE